MGIRHGVGAVGRRRWVAARRDCGGDVDHRYVVRARSWDGRLHSLHHGSNQLTCNIGGWLQGGRPGDRVVHRRIGAWRRCSGGVRGGGEGCRGWVMQAGWLQALLEQSGSRQLSGMVLTCCIVDGREIRADGSATGGRGGGDGVFGGSCIVGGVTWQRCRLLDGSRQLSPCIHVWLQRICPYCRWCYTVGAAVVARHARSGADRGWLCLACSGRDWGGWCGVGSRQLSGTSSRWKLQWIRRADFVRRCVVRFANCGCGPGLCRFVVGKFEFARRQGCGGGRVGRRPEGDCIALYTV